MSRWVGLALCLTACVEGTPDQGTFVGNPGNLDVAVVEVPEDIVLDLAEVSVTDLWLVGCDGPATDVRVDQVFDALGGDDAPVPFPGGRHCLAGLAVDPVLGVRLVGQTAAATDFTMVFDPGVLVIDDPIWIDGHEVLWVVPLAGLDAAGIDALGPGADIAPDDPLAAEVTSRTGSGGLYSDTNGDGLWSSAEGLIGGVRVVDYASTGFDQGIGAEAAQPDGAGCGCHGGATSGGGWALWAGLILLWSRLDRRRVE